jgi:hypothetical protein
MATVLNNKHQGVRTRDTLLATVAVWVALIWWSTATVAALTMGDCDTPGTPYTIEDRGSFSDVRITRTHADGPPVSSHNFGPFSVPTLNHHEGHVFDGARAGGEAANHALEPSQVRFLGSVDPDISGQWSSAIDAQVIPIHTQVLPTGKVLFWQDGGYNTVLRVVCLISWVLGQSS